MPPRVVLDTNVWLDLLVFADPRAQPLADALASGVVQAVTGPACREEFLQVLAYPALALDVPARAQAVARFDRSALLWRPASAPARSLAGESAPEPASVAAASATPPARVPTALPRCADPDDQKFLELARDCGAGWLLSRDNALLALDRRCRRAGLFAVSTPEAWPGPVQPPGMVAPDTPASPPPDMPPYMPL